MDSKSYLSIKFKYIISIQFLFKIFNNQSAFDLAVEINNKEILQIFKEKKQQIEMHDKEEKDEYTKNKTCSIF